MRAWTTGWRLDFHGATRSRIERQRDDDRGAVSEEVDRQLAVGEQHPFAHAGEPEAAVPVPERESTTIICDLGGERAIRDAHPDHGGVRPGVFGDVGQRFLHDAVDGRLDVGLKLAGGDETLGYVQLIDDPQSVERTTTLEPERRAVPRVLASPIGARSPAGLGCAELRAMRFHRRDESWTPRRPSLD